MKTIAGIYSPFRRVTGVGAALITMAGLGLLAGTVVSVAAEPQPVVNEKLADLEPAIADLRQAVGFERRDIVKANMLITNSEGVTFWALYDQYSAARVSLGDRKVRLITDFVAERDSMSQDEATRLTREFLAIEKARVALKETYIKKMSKVLSARTVARFFQIDQKLDAATDLALARNIPLIH